MSEPPWSAEKMTGRRRRSSRVSATTAGHELTLSEKKQRTDLVFRNLSHLLHGWVLCLLSAAPLVLAGVLALSSFLTRHLDLPRAALVQLRVFGGLLWGQRILLGLLSLSAF